MFISHSSDHSKFKENASPWQMSLFQFIIMKQAVVGIQNKIAYYKSEHGQYDIFQITGNLYLEQ